jgi:hypothetical protein
MQVIAVSVKLTSKGLPMERSAKEEGTVLGGETKKRDRIILDVGEEDEVRHNPCQLTYN